MRYTFPYKSSTKTVNIPDEWIQKTKINLNLSTSETIELWLCDNGYEENADQKALNEKAKSTKIQHGAGGKQRKAPVRKPDETKRELIQDIYHLIESMSATKSVEVTNIERIVAFAIGDDNYEITLSKKRKPKD